VSRAWLIGSCRAGPERAAVVVPSRRDKPSEARAPRALTDQRNALCRQPHDTEGAGMQRQNLGPYVIASAIIWGLTIVGASMLMGDVPDKSKVLGLLGTGAGVHLILIWGPLAVLEKLRQRPGNEQNG
jgi:hypothetical protein